MIPGYDFYYSCPFCHCPAFFLKSKPNAGDPILSASVIKTDGKKPKSGSGDKIICGSCNENLPANLSILDIKQIQ